MADIFKSTRWVAASQVSRVGLQLISLVVLGRILGPIEFGVIATASIWTNFALQLRDIGTSSAIIQMKHLNSEILNAIFFVNGAVGVFLFAATIGLSGLAAEYFNMPLLRNVLMALAVSFPLMNIAAAHQALMERETRFTELAVIEISSAVLGFSIAIIAALLGAGVFSFVAQTIVSAAASAVFIIRAGRGFKPKLRFGKSELAIVFGYSGGLTGFNLLNYASRNAHSFFIAKRLGESSLGIYSLAYKVMLFPLQSVSFILTRAIYPYLVKLQDDIPSFGQYYLRAVGAVAFITAPAMALIFFFNEYFVLVFFGEKWIAASAIIAWLAPVGFLQSITSTTSLVFRALGLTRPLFFIGGAISILHVLGFYFSAPYGLTSVSAVYLGTNIFSSIVYFAYLSFVLKRNFFSFILILLNPFLCAVAAGYFGFKIIEIAAVRSIYFNFTFGVFAGVVAYLFLSFVLNKAQLSSFLKFAGARRGLSRG